MTYMLSKNRADTKAAYAAVAISMAELIHKIAENRDKQAFKELFINYAPRVKGLLIKQGADPETADELAQETLFTVWKKAHLFVQQKGNVATWIFTIARNLRIDRLRSETIWSAMDYEVVDQISEDPTQDDLLVEKQRRDVLKDVLENLPSEQYEIVYKSYIGGMSHTEIAESLDLPLGTVKSRMRLAYGKIREMLRGRL